MFTTTLALAGLTSSVRVSRSCGVPWISTSPSTSTTATPDSVRTLSSITGPASLLVPRRVSSFDEPKLIATSLGVAELHRIRELLDEEDAVPPLVWLVEIGGAEVGRV